MNRKQTMRNFIYILTIYLITYGSLVILKRDGISVSFVIYISVLYIGLFFWQFKRDYYKGKVDFDLIFNCLLDLFLCYLLFKKKMECSLMIGMYTVLVTIGIIGTHTMLSKCTWLKMKQHR